MKQNRAVHVRNLNTGDDSRFISQYYAQNEVCGSLYRGRRCNFCSQYDSKEDNVYYRTGRKQICLAQETKKVYAYHGIRSFTDIGVGSVKALSRKKVKKLYVPETDEIGVGCSDLAVYSGGSSNKTKIVKTSYCTCDLATKCVGGPFESTPKPVVTEKLSPIVFTKSATTNPSIFINPEFGSNTPQKKLVSTATQFEVATKKNNTTIIPRKHCAIEALLLTNDKVSKQTYYPVICPEPKPPPVSSNIEKTEEKEIKKYSYINTETQDQKETSSDSLVQHVHNLENPSFDNNSKTSIDPKVDPMENKLEKEYRKIFSPTPPPKETPPKCTSKQKIPEFKSTSTLRRRFEALRKGLSKKDDSRTSTRGSYYSSRKDASVTSDPPSLEGRSFTNTPKYVPATEVKPNRPKGAFIGDTDSEAQGVKGMFKLWGKKFNFEDDYYKKSSTDMHSLKTDKRDTSKAMLNKNSFLSSFYGHGKATENADPVRKDVKKFFFFKKKSKIKHKEPFANTSKVSKVTAGRCEVQEGLSMTYKGVISKGKMSKILENDDLLKKNWLKGFLTNTIESVRSVNVRWNNNMYATSSSTVFELIDTVYKNTKLHRRSRSDTSCSSPYSPFSTPLTSSTINKTSYMQDFQAWMIPRTILDRPIDFKILPHKSSIQNKNIEVTISDQKWLIDKGKALSHKIEVVLHTNNMNNLNNRDSSDYLRIDIPKDFFDELSYDSSKKSQTSDEEVYKIVEYETVSEAKSSKKGVYLDKGDHSSNDIKVIVSVQSSNQESTVLEKVIKRPPMHRDVVTQGSEVFVQKKCDVIGVGIITRDLKDYRKSILELEDNVSDYDSINNIDIEPNKCGFAESYLQEYYKQWAPGLDMYSWAVSDPQIQSPSESSIISIFHQTDLSKSCPNMCESFLTTTSICSSCCHSSNDEKQPSNILQKFKNLTNNSKTDKDIESKRVLPKDSLEVFKKRKLYSHNFKGTWINADDRPVSVPSFQNKGAQDTINEQTITCIMKGRKHVSMPDNEFIGISLSDYDYDSMHTKRKHRCCSRKSVLCSNRNNSLSLEGIYKICKQNWDPPCTGPPCKLAKTSCSTRPCQNERPCKRLEKKCSVDCGKAAKDKEKKKEQEESEKPDESEQTDGEEGESEGSGESEGDETEESSHANTNDKSNSSAKEQGSSKCCKPAKCCPPPPKCRSSPKCKLSPEPKPSPKPKVSPKTSKGKSVKLKPKVSSKSKSSKHKTKTSKRKSPIEPLSVISLKGSPPDSPKQKKGLPKKAPTVTSLPVPASLLTSDSLIVQCPFCRTILPCKKCRKYRVSVRNQTRPTKCCKCEQKEKKPKHSSKSSCCCNNNSSNCPNTNCPRTDKCMQTTAEAGIQYGFPNNNCDCKKSCKLIKPCAVAREPSPCQCKSHKNKKECTCPTTFLNSTNPDTQRECCKCITPKCSYHSLCPAPNLFDCKFQSPRHSCISLCQAAIVTEPNMISCQCKKPGIKKQKCICVSKSLPSKYGCKCVTPPPTTTNLLKKLICTTSQTKPCKKPCSCKSLDKKTKCACICLSNTNSTKKSASDTYLNSGCKCVTPKSTFTKLCNFTNRDDTACNKEVKCDCKNPFKKTKCCCNTKPIKATCSDTFVSGCLCVTPKNSEKYLPKPKSSMQIPKSILLHSPKKSAACICKSTTLTDEKCQCKCKSNPVQLSDSDTYVKKKYLTPSLIKSTCECKMTPGGNTMCQCLEEPCDCSTPMIRPSWHSNVPMQDCFQQTDLTVCRCKNVDLSAGPCDCKTAPTKEHSNRSYGPGNDKKNIDTDISMIFTDPSEENIQACVQYRFVTTPGKNLTKKVSFCKCKFDKNGYESCLNDTISKLKKQANDKSQRSYEVNILEFPSCTNCGNPIINIPYQDYRNQPAPCQCSTIKESYSKTSVNLETSSIRLLCKNTNTFLDKDQKCQENSPLVMSTSCNKVNPNMRKKTNPSWFSSKTKRKYTPINNRPPSSKNDQKPVSKMPSGPEKTETKSKLPDISKNIESIKFEKNIPSQESIICPKCKHLINPTRKSSRRCETKSQAVCQSPKTNVTVICKNRTCPKGTAKVEKEPPQPKPESKTICSSKSSKKSPQRKRSQENVLSSVKTDKNVSENEKPDETALSSMENPIDSDDNSAPENTKPKDKTGDNQETAQETVTDSECKSAPSNCSASSKCKSMGDSQEESDGKNLSNEEYTSDTTKETPKPLKKPSPASETDTKSDESPRALDKLKTENKNTNKPAKNVKHNTSQESQTVVKAKTVKVSQVNLIEPRSKSKSALKITNFQENITPRTVSETQIVNHSSRFSSPRSTCAIVTPAVSITCSANSVMSNRMMRSSMNKKKLRNKFQEEDYDQSPSHYKKYQSNKRRFSEKSSPSRKPLLFNVKSKDVEVIKCQKCGNNLFIPANLSQYGTNNSSPPSSFIQCPTCFKSKHPRKYLIPCQTCLKNKFLKKKPMTCPTCSKKMCSTCGDTFSPTNSIQCPICRKPKPSVDTMLQCPSCFKTKPQGESSQPCPTCLKNFSQNPSQLPSNQLQNQAQNLNNHQNQTQNSNYYQNQAQNPFNHQNQTQNSNYYQNQAQNPNNHQNQTQNSNYYQNQAQNPNNQQNQTQKSMECPICHKTESQIDNEQQSAQGGNNRPQMENIHKPPVPICPGKEPKLCACLSKKSQMEVPMANPSVIKSAPQVENTPSCPSCLNTKSQLELRQQNALKIPQPENRTSQPGTPMQCPVCLQTKPDLENRVQNAIPPGNPAECPICHKTKSQLENEIRSQMKLQVQNPTPTPPTVIRAPQVENQASPPKLKAPSKTVNAPQAESKRTPKVENPPTDAKPAEEKSIKSSGSRGTKVTVEKPAEPSSPETVSIPDNQSDSSSVDTKSSQSKLSSVREEKKHDNTPAPPAQSQSQIKRKISQASCDSCSPRQMISIKQCGRRCNNRNKDSVEETHSRDNRPSLQQIRRKSSTKVGQKVSDRKIPPCFMENSCPPKPCAPKPCAPRPCSPKPCPPKESCSDKKCAVNKRKKKKKEKEKKEKKEMEKMEKEREKEREKEKKKGSKDKCPCLLKSDSGTDIADNTYKTVDVPPKPPTPPPPPESACKKSSLKVLTTPPFNNPKDCGNPHCQPIPPDERSAPEVCCSREKILNQATGFSTHRKESANLFLRLKPSMKLPSKEYVGHTGDEIRMGKLRKDSINLKLSDLRGNRELDNCDFIVRDENGKTIVERKKYCGGKPKPLILESRSSEFNKLSDHRVVTELSSKPQLQESEPEYESDSSVDNLIEIQFKIRVGQGDKATEINIGNEKKHVKDPKGSPYNISDKSTTDVYTMKNGNETPSKNDINIKIVIKKLKTKAEADNLYDEFYTKNISSKFNTVSTGYSEIYSEQNYNELQTNNTVESNMISDQKSKISNLETDDAINIDNINSLASMSFMPLDSSVYSTFTTHKLNTDTENDQIGESSELQGSKTYVKWTDSKSTPVEQPENIVNEEFSDEIPIDTNFSIPSVSSSKIDKKFSDELAIDTNVSLPSGSSSKVDKKFSDDLPTDTNLSVPSGSSSKVDKKFSDDLQIDTDVTLPSGSSSKVDKKYSDEIPTDINLSLPSGSSSKVDKKFSDEIPIDTNISIATVNRSKLANKFSNELPIDDTNISHPSGSSSRVDKKELLKKVMAKARSSPKTAKNVRQLRDMLKIILTDSSDNDDGGKRPTIFSPESSIKELNSSAKELDSSTNSLNNYLNVESNISSIKGNFSSPINFQTESSEIPKLSYGGCMCSKFIEKLNTCGSNLRCCCTQKSKVDEGIHCSSLMDEDADTASIKIEFCDAEVQKSENLSNKTGSYTISVSFNNCENSINSLNRIDKSSVQSTRYSSNRIIKTFSRQKCSEKIKKTSTALSTSKTNDNKSTDSESNVARVRKFKRKAEKSYRYVNAAEILQCYETKKAVLEIYAEKSSSVTGDHLVARLPKFVYGRENEISRNYAKIVSNRYKSVCDTNNRLLMSTAR